MLCLVLDLTIPCHHLPGEPLQPRPAEGHGSAHDDDPAGHALGGSGRWKQIAVPVPRGEQGHSSTFCPLKVGQERGLSSFWVPTGGQYA